MFVSASVHTVRLSWLCVHMRVYLQGTCVCVRASPAFTHRFASVHLHRITLIFGPLPPNSESFFLPAVPKYLCALVAPAGKGDPELPVQRGWRTAAQSCAGAPRCAAAGAARTDAPRLKIPGSSFLSEPGLTANGVGAPLF